MYVIPAVISSWNEFIKHSTDQLLCQNELNAHTTIYSHSLFVTIPTKFQIVGTLCNTNTTECANHFLHIVY